VASLRRRAGDDQRTAKTAELSRSGQRPIPLWGKRADRAYLNAVETFAPFAALVIVAHLAGKANAMTAFWAASYFWLRLAHAAVYLLGIPLVRTILFTLGYVAIVGLFWELIK
jgi:uncharacterized MAPEG superfamily protein